MENTKNNLQNLEIKRYFSLENGSNYEVLMTYDRTEVVEYEQFLKIARVLNDNNARFLTINKRITAISTIIDISPTKKLTEQQKKEKRKQNNDLTIEDYNGKPIKLSELTGNTKA